MTGAAAEPSADPPAEPVHPRPPDPSPRESKPSRDLALRLLTAALLIPLVLLLIWAGGLWFLGAVIAVILLGLREFYRLIEDKGAHPLKNFGYLAGAALPVVAYVGDEYHATILMTAVLLAVMVAQLGKAEISEALASISGTFFGVFYVGWLLTHAVVLRQFSQVASRKWGALGVQSVPDQAGAFYMFFALATVIACDAGAYFAGRAYGRHKLAPHISPGKTVEGAVGGVAAGLLAALVAKGLSQLFMPSLSEGLPWLVVVPFGVVLSVVGIVGDLVESLLKRDAKVKDTGALLPGTGGVLDRIDSSLLGIPVMYYLVLAYHYLRLVRP